MCTNRIYLCYWFTSYFGRAMRYTIYIALFPVPFKYFIFLSWPNSPGAIKDGNIFLRGADNYYCRPSDKSQWAAVTDVRDLRGYVLWAQTSDVRFCLWSSRCAARTCWTRREGGLPGWQGPWLLCNWPLPSTVSLNSSVKQSAQGIMSLQSLHRRRVCGLPLRHDSYAPQIDGSGRYMITLRQI